MLSNLQCDSHSSGQSRSWDPSHAPSLSPSVCLSRLSRADYPAVNVGGSSETKSSEEGKRWRACDQDTRRTEEHRSLGREKRGSI